MLLSELIALPFFTNARIIAGAQGLARNVESVNMMDAPDIIQYLKPNDLLLTTGYAMKDHPTALNRLVASMAHVGCAGLAIKTKRFISVVPPEVLETANFHNFPIIELSLEHSLGDIANHSLSYILEKRTDELHYALSTHKKFSQMIMQGSTIPEIIESLSQLITLPVLLVNSILLKVSSSSHFNQASFGSLIPHLQDQLSSLADLPLDTHMLPLTPFLDIGSEFKYPYAALYPIRTFQQEGFLAVLTESLVLQNLEKHAIEQAANVIGLEMMKQQAVKERSRRYKNEFFSDFVEGLITSEQELIHRSKKYNLLGHPSYMSVVAKRDGSLQSLNTTTPLLSDGKSISERDRMYSLLKLEISKLDIQFVLFTKNVFFCFLLAFPTLPDDETAKDNKLLDDLKGIVSRMEEQHNLSISFGVGNPISKLTDMPISYKEALEALQSGYNTKKIRFVQPYSAKDVNNLLRMIPKEELRDYYAETFKTLLDVEGKERRELLKTLAVFYDTHCQLAETARVLFVHRNTVIYRLEKCEKLTGRDLSNPAESLRFRVAFAIEPLITDEKIR
jgi:PucR family transcriptional regulator, purine catabolism regulatory protein